ncbi:hypothetical protein ACMC5R_06525 [Deferribacteres bacterium DY0037]|uniref:SLOG cluster 4 domain-containing protein n=1 Tax=Denitrovibrio acetiphilus TaxID=118000 RepID=UPI00019B3A40|nr:hypothetical protein [Denitrovibrio acetiphilus]
MAAGSSICDDLILEAAHHVWELAATKGFVVLRGGLAGVMEHTLHGAKNAGG